MSVGLCICKLIKCVIITKQLLKSTETVKSDFSLEFGAVSDGVKGQRFRGKKQCPCYVIAKCAALQ